MRAQTRTQNRQPLLTILLVILTALWLVGVSFRVVLLGPVTSFFAERTVNDRLSELSHAQLVEVAETGRAFVVGEKGVELPAGSDYRTAFPPDVIGHMEDVRSVIHDEGIATLVLTVLLIAALALAGRKGGSAVIGTGLLIGGTVAVVLVLTLAVVGFLSFDTLFENMHRLFFAEGTWTFAEDSLLICAYPLVFWIGMGLAWAVVLAFFSALASAMGFFLKKSALRGNAQRYASK